MVDAPAVFIVVAILAAVVGIGILVYRHEKKRREAFQSEATRLGLAYEHQSSESLPQTYARFGAFNHGFDRRAFNVLRGKHRGIEVRLFDFRYKTRHHDGKNTRTQTHYVGVALALLGQPFPRTTIVPETLGHKLWDAVGGDDIDFESDEFSRKFWVKSDDRRAAYDLIHARMMEYLMTPGWTRWEIVTPGICVSNAGRVRPQDCQAILDRIVGFVERMPQHGGRAPVAVGARA